MPASDLEIALSKVGHDEFEELCADLLTREGYKVTPTSTSGPDGGRESLLEYGGSDGILHCSIERGLEAKLRKDAEKAANDEREYEFFFFGTTADPAGVKRDRLEREFSEEYGWDVTIWDYSILRNKLIGEIDNHALAEEHLGVNPGVAFGDNKESVYEKRDERLDQIEARYDLPFDLIEGPAIVLHLIPNGMFSKDYGCLPEELPEPPFYGMNAGRGESVGDGKVSVNRRFVTEHSNYSYIDEDGWIEAVTTDLRPPFRPEEHKIIRGDFDQEILVMLPRCLDCLQTIGAKPPIFAFVSLIDVSGYVLDTSDMWFTPREFSDRYIPRHATIDSHGRSPEEEIRPVLDRIWQKGGRSNGSPFYPNR